MSYLKGDTVVITPTLAGISTDQVQDVCDWNVYKTVNGFETFIEEISVTPIFPEEEGDVLFVFGYTYVIVEDSGDSLSFRFEPSGTEANLSDAILGDGNGLDWEIDLGEIVSAFSSYVINTKLMNGVMVTI